jgi:hypothetical protein
MCSIDDCDPWKVRTQTMPQALKGYRCGECRRTIRAGERYDKLVGLLCDGGEWETHRTCRHCAALASFMNVLCGGYVINDLLSELVEHWHEGYSSIEVGRWIACMRLRWHDGADPIPTQAGAVARQMLGKAVA